MSKLLKFEKDNCVGCAMVEGYLESKGIKAEKINPFDNPELTTKYNISSVPVTILLDDEGNEVKRVIGFKPAELEDIINSL
jgi:thioredoxin 1